MSDADVEHRLNEIQDRDLTVKAGFVRWLNEPQNKRFLRTLACTSVVTLGCLAMGPYSVYRNIECQDQYFNEHQYSDDNDMNSGQKAGRDWEIAGITLSIAAVASLFIVPMIYIKYRRSHFTPVRINNILLSIPAEDKEFLITAEILASTESKITPDMLSKRIYQKKCQFALFKAPDMEKLPGAIVQIISQYAKDASLLPHSTGPS